ncbi:hypothetical protein ACJRO7_014854 [Eucalyptus globulus]|uniref:RING-type E3 ubiquitin transferase n=1 Tax=Eucalyptus globulus TaxID=34317 RepID=A0ABD3L5G4_EUCGL
MTVVSLRRSNDNVVATGRGGEGSSRERLIAVAIDKDKPTRYALQWAIENVISLRNQTLKLVHVKSRPSTSSPFPACSEETQPDAQTAELFLRFRCYCLQRHVKCDLVVLENSDVAKALVEYVSRYAVDTLLIGTASRKSFSRLFKFVDTPNTILKYAPDYCNIFVVGKGKAVSVRPATCPRPNLLTIEKTAQVDTLNHVSLCLLIDILTIMNSGHPSSRPYDELSTCENDFSRANSGRLSTNSSFLSFYEDLGLGRMSSSSACLRFEDDETSTRLSTFSFASALEPPTRDGEQSMPWSLHFAEAVEEEMLRTKLELKRTIDLYHAACKEAIGAKQTVRDCHKYQNELEKKLLKARSLEQAAWAVMEKEREKSKAAEKARRMADEEARKRWDAEKKAQKEVEFQSLVHIMGSDGLHKTKIKQKRVLVRAGLGLPIDDEQHPRKLDFHYKKW